MKKIIDWFLRVVVLGQDELQSPLTVPKRYMLFRRTLLLVMTSIFLIPLTITSVLSYYQYKALIEKKETTNLLWNAENTKQSIETLIEELQSSLILATNIYGFERLTDQEELNKLFQLLKAQYPGIVDLGIINNDGIQQTYVGPYNLKGKKYSNREFFQTLFVRKTHIDAVAMGYRNVPHFSVAVSFPTSENGNVGILRTSIDAATLSQYVVTTNKGLADDIFLVSYQGRHLLQTPSRYYGNVLDLYPVDLLPSRNKVTISEEASEGGPPMLKAMAYLEGTPWVLVLVKQGFLYGKDWSDFEKQLFFIFFMSLILVLWIIQHTRNLLVRRIHDSDEKREAMFIEMEHTSKLAAVGRLATGVAHEINNPLAIINEKTGLIKDLLKFSDDFKHKEKITGLIDGTTDAVERCKVITHRLLGFARRMDVALEPINIYNLIKEVWGFLKEEALYRGIILHMEQGESLPPVESDRGQLQQIFLNLINNALDAIEKEGIVSILIKPRDQDYLQIDIVDNGPGMPQEVTAQIFEPFFTTKTDGKIRGTGLGLSITYGLVKKLGGDILVKSILGTGTTFTLLLPLKYQMHRRSTDGSESPDS